MNESIHVTLYIQVINEPYVAAVSFGPEKMEIKDEDTNKLVDEIEEELKEQEDLEDAPLAFDDDQCTYDWVKKTLEADYPGKKLIFCKDMAFIIPQENKYHALPNGFKHTFIIRDPLKMFLSLRKFYLRLINIPAEHQNAFRLTDLTYENMPPKYCYGEMVDLLHYLQENQMESSPVVIDADDLLSNPESILRQYCEAIGVPFSSDLLQWESGDDITCKWIVSKKILKANKLDRGGFYGRALASSQFETSTKSTPDEKDLTPDVLQLAKDAEKYYKELYELRLRP